MNDGAFAFLLIDKSDHAVLGLRIAVGIEYRLSPFLLRFERGQERGLAAALQRVERLLGFADDAIIFVIFTIDDKFFVSRLGRLILLYGTLIFGFDRLRKINGRTTIN